MENWQSKAVKSFPELESQITRNQGGLLGLWPDLYAALTAAYRETPINENLIRRIYEYAGWCFRQPEGEGPEGDLSNATAVGLIESLPLDQRVSDDLHRWMSVETFEGCEKLFRYHLTEDEFGKWHAAFVGKKKGVAAPSLF
jgi:hypothetical protein